MIRPASEGVVDPPGILIHPLCHPAPLRLKEPYCPDHPQLGGEIGKVLRSRLGSVKHRTSSGRSGNGLVLALPHSEVSSKVPVAQAPSPGGLAIPGAAANEVGLSRPHSRTYLTQALDLNAMHHARLPHARR